MFLWFELNRNRILDDSVYLKFQPEFFVCQYRIVLYLNLIFSFNLYFINNFLKQFIIIIICKYISLNIFCIEFLFLYIKYGQTEVTYKTAQFRYILRFRFRFWLNQNLNICLHLNYLTVESVKKLPMLSLLKAFFSMQNWVRNRNWNWNWLFNSDLTFGQFSKM